MRKGICLTALYPQAMEHADLLIKLFHKVQETGIFDCVEFYFHGQKEEEEKIADTLEKLGLSSVFLAGYPMKRDKVDISSEDEKIRKKGVEICRDLYTHACRMHADKMLIISGPVWQENHQELMVTQTRKSLMEIGEQLQQDGPEITLEYFNYLGEPWLAVGDIPVVKKIFSVTPPLKVGITFDTSHTAQLKADIGDAFEELKPWVRHIHLANSVSSDEKSPLFGDKHPLFSVKNGDFSLQSIREIYGELEAAGKLQNIDICSFEVISRGEEECYFNETCREAAFVWNKESL